jgi:hypothetical protein
MNIILTTKISKKQLRYLNYEKYKKSKISNIKGFDAQFRFTIFLILVLLFIYMNFICQIPHMTNVLKVVSFDQLFNISNPINKRIIIFETNPYHYECTPGFSKYFVKLGYNVDIIMHSEGKDSFVLFKEISKITLFIYNNINEIKKNIYKLSLIIQKYDFVLLQTTDPQKKRLYNDLGLFSINNSIFVHHDIQNMGNEYIKYINQNRVWALGNFSKVLFINPHYFGDIKLFDKNIKTRFFLTASVGRNYKYLLESSERLKKENFYFEIIVTGRINNLNLRKIPEFLKDNYIFRHNCNYSQFYNVIQNSDYIILPLDPNRKFDREYNKYRSSGSIQLMLGFLKPTLINQEFAGIYHLNKENSLLYNNSNFYDIMKKAILLNNEEYKTIQNNLKKTAKEIYDISLNNVKKTLKSIIKLKK